MLIKLQNIEQNLKSQINGKNSHVHRSEDLLLLKQQFSLNWSIDSVLLLLLLSRLSRVRLCGTLYTAAHQAPLSLGFSRQEHWSGLPFPSPVHESEKWKWSCSVAYDSATPCSPPGSSVHGIFQATVLEWGANAVSIKISDEFLQKSTNWS